MGPLQIRGGGNLNRANPSGNHVQSGGVLKGSTPGKGKDIRMRRTILKKGRILSWKLEGWVTVGRITKISDHRGTLEWESSESILSNDCSCLLLLFLYRFKIRFSSIQSRRIKKKSSKSIFTCQESPLHLP